MMPVLLKKYRILENEYLVYDPQRNDVVLDKAQIQLLCDRHNGLGADGFIIGPSFKGKKINIKMYNADGRVVRKNEQMLEVFSKYIVDEAYMKDQFFMIFTLAGKVMVDLFEIGNELQKISVSDITVTDFFARQIREAGRQNIVCAS
jgi:diaminopimelate epimerase